MSRNARGRGYDDGDALDPTPALLAVPLGAVGGGLALLAFPPYGLWWLLPIALGLLSAAVLTRSWVTAVLSSLAWGLAFFVPMTHWAATYAGTPPWLALGVFESLYIVLYGLLARVLLVRWGPGLKTLVGVACLWVGVESLRSHAPWGGLPWGASGFALADSPLLTLGPWIGMAGLAFVMSVFGSLLFNGVLALLGRRHRGLGGIGGVWPIAVVFASVLACAVVPTPGATVPKDRSTLRVVGIQGSMDPIDPATLAMPDDVLTNNIATTNEALAAHDESGRSPALILWPEDSVGSDPREDPAAGYALTALAQRADAPLLVGTQTPEGEHHRYNVSVLWTPQGEASWTYAKRHPVPFGEYVPMRSVLRTVSPMVDMVTRDMLPGDEVGVLDLGSEHGTQGKIGVLICFEIAYDNLAHDVVDDGAELIVVQSNNALFGTSHEAIQQLAQAKVIGVITGRSVVHLSTVGHSAVYDPEGRRMDFVEHWEQGFLAADVPLRTTITPAVAAGSWPAIVMSALGVLAVAAALASSTRAVAAPVSRRRGTQNEPQRRSTATTRRP